MEKKWSKKKKIAVWTCVSLFVILSAFILFYVFKPDKGAVVDTVEVKRGTVIQTLEKTGVVEADDEGKFSLPEGVTVKKVRVKVGQTVKKGQILVTFNTSSLDAVAKEKYDDYMTAKNAYDKYISSASSSNGQLSAVNSEISELEKKIKNLEKKVENNKKKKAEVTENQKKEIEELKAKLTKIINDSVAGSKILEFIESRSESAQEFIDTLKKLIEKSGTTNSLDMSAVTSIIDVSEEQSELLDAQIEMAKLKAKQATLKIQSDNGLEKIYLKIVDAAEKAYNKAQKSADKLKGGWVARADGIVSEVKIKDGEKISSDSGDSGSFDISSIISAVTSGEADISSLMSGMTSTASKNVLTVKYYPLTASFTLNKSEFAKVDVDKEVTVSSTGDNKLTGKVIFKSPVASESGGMDLSAIVGGNTGTTSKGVETKIQIDNPDSSVIIGMNVDISIETDRAENVITVPIESIQYENSKAYVFVYNADKKTVNRTEVQVGLRDDASYEVLSGCSVGDILVKSPSTTLKDGDRVQLKKTDK